MKFKNIILIINGVIIFFKYFCIGIAISGLLASLYNDDVDMQITLLASIAFSVFAILLHLIQENDLNSVENKHNRK